MRLLQLKLRRILAGNDAFTGIDEMREAIQQSGLAGAGAAGNQHVAADAADNLQDLAALRRNRA